jgi:hypothetical protein
VFPTAAADAIEPEQGDPTGASRQPEVLIQEVGRPKLVSENTLLQVVSVATQLLL